MTDAKLSAYDREALQEIADFKNPDRGMLSKLADKVHEPIDKIGEKAFDTTVGGHVETALTKVLENLQSAAAWTVREDKILEDFRDDGHEVESFEAIAKLELEEVEDVIGHLARKYKVMAMAEGAAVGAVGVAGIAADIPLILGIALRGVTEFAGYYGFYPFSDDEKLYVLDLLSAAASPTQSVRQENLDALVKHGVEMARGRRDEAQTVLAIQAVEKIAEALVARLARGKVAQSVPLVGALIGGGFNRWFVASVMTMAEMAYRERFLMRKYGVDAIQPPPA